MHEKPENVYNQLGNEYYSSMHKTVEFFNRVQEGVLKNFLLTAQSKLSIPFQEMKVLNVGPGTEGNNSLMMGRPDQQGHGKDAGFNPRNITYLDISAGALQSLQSELRKTVERYGGVVMSQYWDSFDRIPLDQRRELRAEYMRGSQERKEKIIRLANLDVVDDDQLGIYIVGDGQKLEASLQENTQDIVFAALCDHIPDQRMFFEQAQRVLRHGGALITSYPATELNKAIREKIYGIDANSTRFMIDGKPHLLPSRTVTQEELLSMYEQVGFEDVLTEDVLFNSGLEFEPSETIKKGMSLVGKSIEQIPILVSGVGFKKSAQ